VVVASKQLSHGLVQLTVLVAFQVCDVHPFVVAAHDVVVLGFEGLVEVEGLVGRCEQ